MTIEHSASEKIKRSVPIHLQKKHQLELSYKFVHKFTFLVLHSHDNGCKHREGGCQRVPPIPHSFEKNYKFNAIPVFTKNQKLISLPFCLPKVPLLPSRLGGAQVGVPFLQSSRLIGQHQCAPKSGFSNQLSTSPPSIHHAPKIQHSCFEVLLAFCHRRYVLEERVCRGLEC